MMVTGKPVPDYFLTVGKDEILSRAHPIGMSSTSSVGPAASAGLGGIKPAIRPSACHPGTLRALAFNTTGAAAASKGW
jgi:hypothetical protein